LGGQGERLSRLPTLSLLVVEEEDMTLAVVAVRVAIKQVQHL
jgi:hypothetical protein